MPTLEEITVYSERLRICRATLADLLTQWVRLLLLLLLLLATIGGVVAFLALRPSPAERELAAARARWQARPFAAYRLTLRVYDPAPPGGCQQDLIIRNEQVVEVLRNECQRFRDPMTVSSLFAMIEPDEQWATTTTALDPCLVGSECERVRDVQVSYDPLLGYPQTVIVREDYKTNWMHPMNWQELLRYGHGPVYSFRLSPFAGHVEVEALVPLPSARLP